MPAASFPWAPPAHAAPGAPPSTNGDNGAHAPQAGAPPTNGDNDRDARGRFTKGNAGPVLAGVGRQELLAAMDVG